MSKTFILKSLACAAMVATAGASQAMMTVYTTLASFNAATALQGTDTFANLSLVDPTASPLPRNTVTGVSYSYTASAPGGFFGAAVGPVNSALSTDSSTAAITFSGWSSSIIAVGGNFFGTDQNGAFLTGDIEVTATDSNSRVRNIVLDATRTSFLGFVSDGTMISLTVRAVTPVAPALLWPTVDNLTLAVPEPGTYALFAAGLAAVGFIARRRRG